MTRPNDKKKQPVPTCGVAHDRLDPADQEACAQGLPCGVREQMQALLGKYDGDVGLVASWLGASERTVRRHAKGTFLPAGFRLRDQLTWRALRASCPVYIAEDQAEAERLAQGAAQRDARRALRERRDLP
ncbi:hypothetical protein [Streptomyces sp. HUAS TT7]|uniref:hypothetical protein n=1 Tax=Streptomyces sp. HUAS TT7 TaxID=3447507 RepID=UPI003F65C7FC